MIREALIALLFPVRLRVRAWRDRRTADMRQSYARALREIRKARRTNAAAPDLHVRIDRGAVPAWLQQLPENVTILRRQAS